MGSNMPQCCIWRTDNGLRLLAFPSLRSVQAAAASFVKACTQMQAYSQHNCRSITFTVKHDMMTCCFMHNSMSVQHCYLRLLSLLDQPVTDLHSQGLNLHNLGGGVKGTLLTGHVTCPSTCTHLVQISLSCLYNLSKPCIRVEASILMMQVVVGHVTFHTEQSPRSYIQCCMPIAFHLTTLCSSA